MTPEERAEKIMGIVRNPDTISPDQMERGAAQIREAVEEAHQATHGPSYLTGKRTGAKEAYEDAAKIADNFMGLGDLSSPCAEAIRARAKEKA